MSRDRYLQSSWRQRVEGGIIISTGVSISKSAFYQGRKIHAICWLPNFCAANEIANQRKSTPVIRENTLDLIII